MNTNGDLIFTNGQCPVTSESAEIVAQRLTIRLRTFLGEWWLNTSYGVPYLQSILGYKTTKESVDRIMQEQILGENGVLELIEFNSSLGANRQYEMNFRVRARNNELTQLITINLEV